MVKVANIHQSFYLDFLGCKWVIWHYKCLKNRENYQCSQFWTELWPRWKSLFWPRSIAKRFLIVVCRQFLLHSAAYDLFFISCCDTFKFLIVGVVPIFQSDYLGDILKLRLQERGRGYYRNCQRMSTQGTQVLSTMSTLTF